jgi:hypothetical protein
MKKKLSQESRAARFDAEYPFFLEMRQLFRKSAEAVMNRMVETQTRRKIDRCVGVEIESSCIRESDGLPLDEDARNRIVESNPGFQTELGSAQIEIMTPPILLTVSGGFSSLFEAMRTETKVLDTSLHQVFARTVRLGSDPNVFADERCRTHSKERYRLVPGFHTKHRRPGMPSYFGKHGSLIRCDDAASVGAMSSIQYNLDCLSVADGIELLNRAFVNGPYAVALGANARFLDGMDTGYADVRSIVWEFSHDIRTYAELSQGLSGRMGLPTNYFDSLHEYFQDLHDQPSILNMPDQAFELATGLYWKDARLKFLRLHTDTPQIVLEFRPLSLQPSVFEDFALIVFSLGNLMSAQARKERILPLPLVHDNRWSAMLHGTSGKLWMMDNGRPVQGVAKEVLAHQIRFAAMGMQVLGASSHEIAAVQEVWQKRLVDGCPSETFYQRVRTAAGDRVIDRGLLRECLLAEKEPSY